MSVWKEVSKKDDLHMVHISVKYNRGLSISELTLINFERYTYP